MEAKYETIPAVACAQSKTVTVGNLFDIRTNTAFLSNSLWTNEKLRDENLLIEQTPFTNYKVFKSDTVSERMDAMSIGAKIFVRVLFFETELGANFMFKKKRNSRHTSVTARFSKTTETKKLTSWHLKNIDSEEVNVSATHVVSGITYGANAFLNFEKNYSRTEDIFETGGALKKIVAAIPGLSSGGNVSAKESETIKFDYFGDFDTPNHQDTVAGALEVFQDLNSPQNQARAVPLTLFLTPLHRLGLPKPSVPIVEMQSRTELAIMDYMETAKAVREQLATIEDIVSTKMSKSSDFYRALEVVINEVDRKEAEVTQFIKDNKEDEDALMAKLELAAESTASSWMSLFMDEVDAFEEFVETTKEKLNDKSSVIFSESELRVEELENSNKDIIVCNLSLMSMLKKDKDCPEKKPNKSWVSDGLFFRDALKVINAMSEAKKEEEADKFKFIVKVEYMQKENGQSVEENQKSLELKRTPGRVPEVLSSWEEEVFPVLNRIQINEDKIITLDPPNKSHLSVEYEFSTMAVQEESSGTISKVHQGALPISDADLKPGTRYSIRARYKAPTTGLLGPWSLPVTFKTDIQVNGELSFR